MALIFKWLLRLASAAVLLTVLAVIGVWYFASRSLPDYDQRLDVDGLQSPVEIVRDTANVPHIFGGTAEAVYFGLGYAHAQDRLWQMMMMRRTAQGRLSELFGEATLPIDKLLRRLDLYGLSVQSVAALDSPTLAVLKAYSDGVNARLAQINDEALGRGAPEFFVFPSDLPPWTAADSVAVLKLMALQLAGHLETEVLRARVSLVLPPERVRDILPDVPGQGIAALPDYAAVLPDGAAETLRLAARDAPDARHPLHPSASPWLAGASNAWAAAPDRSASGGTLLANDPHLGLSAPTIWYLARLDLPTGAVIGGTIPGMPTILAGRSAALGWGVTSSYLDDQDLFLEELNPENPEEYRTPEGFKPFRSRSSRIAVKDADPVTITLRWTENGPVIPGEHYGLAGITPKGHVMALGWTALSPRDTSMTALINMMAATSTDAAIAVAEDFIAPSQNLTLADRDGIAMKMIGAMPRRAARHQSAGRLPAPGWLPENRWQGRFGYAANPEFRQPTGGILGNTNNKIVDRPFPLHVSYKWGDTQRIQRWQRLMQGREVHTRESFIEAQLDTVSRAARTLLPLIGAELWFTGDPAPDGTPERQRQRALTLLAAWNGEMNEHMPEPLIYMAWVRALQDRLIRDDLGPLAERFTHVDPLFIERVFRDVDGAAGWCDVKQSAATETCTDIARQALDEALIWINETWSPALESLRWGDAHQATHDHQVLGQVPLLGYFVNIRQSTSGGDNTLQRAKTKGGFGPGAFNNVHAAGFRGVYDFADPDSSVFVTATGQSGHFLSRHYDDLGELWRRGEYVPMSLDPDLARAAAVGVTVLLPKR